MPYCMIIDHKTAGTSPEIGTDRPPLKVSEQLPEQERRNAKFACPVEGRQLKLHFINATSPQEMNNLHALSQIRSHVSKESHARRRRDLKERLALYHTSNTSGMQQLQDHVSNSGKEACIVGFPWPLSKDEFFLFNFFLEWVIPNGWTECITEESQHSFQRGMRSTFVPVAVTDRTLFTALLYVSARRYSLISNNVAEAERYYKLMIQYLLACLQKMKVIIKKDSNPTDAAMALALCMATEAYWEGQVEAFYIHGGAFTKMVQARKAFPKQERVSPFLLEMASKSIYDPRFNITIGPCAETGIIIKN